VTEPADEKVVAAVVLAAGASTRMGRNKLLLELDGETLVRRAVRAAVEAGLDRVVVVLGHDEERVRSELGGLACQIVVNADYARGAGTSVHAGVRQAADADAVVIMLADMPLVTAAMIAALAGRYRATGAPLVVSHYRDAHSRTQAPPTLFDRGLLAELLSIDDDQCGKRVVRNHQDEAQVLTWPASALRDVDLLGDYEALRGDRPPR
jgi:molybdenum cofactor cytidylyltransferase